MRKGKIVDLEEDPFARAFDRAKLVLLPRVIAVVKLIEGLYCCQNLSLRIVAEGCECIDDWLGGHHDQQEPDL